MNKYITVGALGLVMSVFAACDKANNFRVGMLWGSADNGQHIEESAAQRALRKDARFARTMPLKHFARYMKSRQPYYRQFNSVQYQDDFVKIKMEGSRVKIETPKGKVKFEYTGS